MWPIIAEFPSIVDNCPVFPSTAKLIVVRIRPIPTGLPVKNLINEKCNSNPPLNSAQCQFRPGNARALVYLDRSSPGQDGLLQRARYIHTYQVRRTARRIPLECDHEYALRWMHRDRLLLFGLP